MGRPFAAGKKAIGYCDRCGFQYLLKDLRSEVVNMEETDVKACPECWDPDNPQTQLGRHYFSEAQALRNPRPVGGTSGRELPYSHRWDFVNPTVTTGSSTGSRFDGWWASNNILSYSSGDSYLTLDSAPSGQQVIYNGWNNTDTPTWISPAIDCSVYKHINMIIRVNRFPVLDDDDKYDFAFAGNAYFVLTDSGGTSYPYSGAQKVESSFSVLSFVNAQTADGFGAADKDMATYFKITWDMSSNPLWSGQCYSLRFDIFDTQPASGASDDDNESIQIHSISVDAYYNPDI
tara:strand:- start:14243 stop:15112 length:870 start_codon:yes stop_codon:yes gene_type:complete